MGACPNLSGDPLIAALAELFEELHAGAAATALRAERTFGMMPTLSEMVRTNAVCPTDVVVLERGRIEVQLGELGPIRIIAVEEEARWRFGERDLTHQIFERLRMREAAQLHAMDRTLRLTGEVELSEESLRARAEALVDHVSLTAHSGLVRFATERWERFCLGASCVDTPIGWDETLAYGEAQTVGRWIALHRARRDPGGAEMYAGDAAWVVFHASPRGLERLGTLRVGAYAAERIFHDPDVDSIWESHLQDVRSVTLHAGCLEVDGAFRETRNNSRFGRRPVRVTPGRVGPPHPGPFDGSEVSVYAEAVNVTGAWRVDARGFTRVASCGVTSRPAGR